MSDVPAIVEALSACGFDSDDVQALAASVLELLASDDVSDALDSRGYGDVSKGVTEALLDHLTAPRSLPRGLCGNRTAHAPHQHDSLSLGRFWCTANEQDRVPWALEKKHSTPVGDLQEATGC